MITCYIGLGSNLDDPRQQVQKALENLAAMDGVEQLQCSSIYRSAPLGPQDQPDFINAVARLECDLEALDLLHALQDIENQHGRVRKQHWGPRTLDLDLLLYGLKEIDHAELKVPHPEMPNRNFVLIPLYEIAPQLTIPGMGDLAKLLQHVNSEGLERIDGS